MHSPPIRCRVLRGRRLLAYPGLRGALEEMFAQRIRSPFLLSTLVDMHEEGAGLGAGPEDEERAAHLKVALEVREGLDTVFQSHTYI